MVKPINVTMLCCVYSRYSHCGCTISPFYTCCWVIAPVSHCCGFRSLWSQDGLGCTQSLVTRIKTCLSLPQHLPYHLRIPNSVDPWVWGDLGVLKILPNLWWSNMAVEHSDSAADLCNARLDFLTSKHPIIFLRSIPVIDIPIMYL